MCVDAQATEQRASEVPLVLDLHIAVSKCHF